MKQYRIQISPTADKDLGNITDYIVDTYDSVLNANKVYDKIMNAISSLSTFPKKNSSVVSQPERDLGMRIKTVDKYSLVYWVEEDSVMVYHIAPTSSQYIAKLRGCI